MKVFNVFCYVQFGKCFDIDIEAKNKKCALNKLRKVIEDIGYEYCKGDEIIVQVDNCSEIKEKIICQ